MMIACSTARLAQAASLYLLGPGIDLILNTEDQKKAL
jgi:hypothetical protein